MATIPTAQLDADLAAIEWASPADEGTWRDTVYPGRFTVLSKQDNLKEGGWDPAYDASLYVRASLFTGPRPTVDDIITVNGTNFIVALINIHPDAVDIEFQLKSP